jgi:hypothetical protein
MMAIFKSDVQLESELSRPELRVGLSGVVTVVLVAVCCAAAFLPFGDAAEGLNFVGGPVVAGIVTGFVVRKARRVRIGLAIAAIVSTFVLMLAAVAVAVALYGL